VEIWILFFKIPGYYLELPPNYTSVDPKQMQKFSIILYMRIKEPRMRQVWETSKGEKGETSVKWAQRTQTGRQVWETRVGDKYGRQVWETSMEDKYGRQVW
jgi:hypothetical protein